MATNETVVIECDECGATFSPPEPTKSIKEARMEAAENNWSHVIAPYEVDWCPECTKAEKPFGPEITAASKIYKNKRDARIRLMKAKEVAEARIKELSQISLAKDNELDRLEVENKRYYRERTSWNNLANKHAKRQHQLEAKFKAVNDVIKKLSGEDVVYVKWIRNALKGVVLSDKTTTPRVEVDEKGTVVYCEYADDCPSAIEASEPKKKNKKKS